MPCVDHGMCELPGAKLRAGAPQDLLEPINSLWGSDIESKQLFSVGSNLGETNSFTSIT